MECQRAREILGAYADGELEAQESDRLRDHLDHCAGCAKELEFLKHLAGGLAQLGPVNPPVGLWPAIEQRLNAGPPAAQPCARRSLPRIPLAAAAAVVVIIGAGLLAIFGLEPGGGRATAAPVNFGSMLDALPSDADKAFGEFLARYDAKEVGAEQAREASSLDFDAPATLPGGFQLQAVYVLNMGQRVGAAARYGRDGELLLAVFHGADQRGDFGARRAASWVLGKYRGQKVEVGGWRLVNLSDATTCHCVLSHLNEQVELPAVLASLAPAMTCSNCKCIDCRCGQ